MKKTIKTSAAIALALSAVTPVAAFAAEETVVKPGIYTATDFTPLTDFTKLTTGEKVALLLDPTAVIVYSKGALKADLILESNEAIEKGTYASAAAYAEANGVEFTENGLKGNVGSELKVESVSAITATAVEINITALTEDNEALEVEVKDGKGNVVATKPVAVSAGETTITVEFVTEVKTADLVGVWTVNGVEFNLDAINQLDAIIKALEVEGELALYNALVDASIENVNEKLVEAYKGALAEAELTSLEAVQAIIDKINAANTTASEAVAVVKEVFNAKGNQVSLSKALNNQFERVNSEWIPAYQEAVTTLFTEEGIESADAITELISVDLLDLLQDAIDAVNLEVVVEEFAAVESTIDTSKFAAVRTLIDTYKVAPEEGAVDGYGYMVDVLDYQTAIAAVTTATTNSALSTALTKLDTALKQYTEKYEGKTISEGITGFKNGADNFDLTKVKTDATSLSAYRTAIKAVEEVGSKNQAKDIQAIIEIENGKLSGAAVEKVLENLNGVNKATTATKVVEYLKAAQDLDTDLTSATKKEIKSAYAEAYKTAVLDKLATEVAESDPVAYEKFEAVSEVNILVGSVNDTQDAATLLKALNDATTAAQVSSALIDLGSTDFINVHADDKLTVAAAVLAARETLETKKFADADAYNGAVTVAVEARTEALGAANELNSASTITEAQAVLADVAPTTYSALSNQAKVDAGQALLDSLEFGTTANEDGTFPLKTKFKTLKAVLTAAGL